VAESRRPTYLYPPQRHATVTIMRINLAWPFLTLGCIAVVALGFLTGSLFGSAAVGIIVGLVLLVAVTLFVQARWDARDPAATAAIEQHVEQVLTRVLAEEVDELEAAVQRLPRTQTYDSPYDEAAYLIKDARSTVDPAVRSRLENKDHRTITYAVTDVAGARSRIDELLERGDDRGRHALGPCFADPRHGPASVPEQKVALPDRSTEKVPLCSVCAERVRVGLGPQFRMIEDGKPAPYWDLCPVSHPYVNGYWGKRTFPLRRVQLERHLDPATAAELRTGGGRRVRFYFSVSASSREGNRSRL
ncbi:MAG: hypothetical protein J2O46_04415, partial [Nocardioides sp.]|nr:hypothetical protein [Nocardioides sp.]